MSLSSTSLYSAETAEITEIAEIKVAVAANFKTTMRDLVAQYQSTSLDKITLITGSTGSLYAQITNGAPYDMFFSADAERPRLLIESRYAVADSLFTYATGELVLWSADPDLINASVGIPDAGKFRRLAIANPVLAPYGLAAEQVLQNLDVLEALKSKLVRGENITQTAQFIQSGNAQLGFIARSQLTAVDPENAGSYWVVPQQLYFPIDQQAVILNDSKASRDFKQFMESHSARTIITAHGYQAN